MFDLAYTLESYDLIATEGIKDVAKGMWKKIIGVLSALKEKLIKKASELIQSARKLLSRSKGDNTENKFAKGAGKNIRSPKLRNSSDEDEEDEEDDTMRALPAPSRNALPAPSPKSANERRREINNFSKGQGKSIARTAEIGRQASTLTKKYMGTARHLAGTMKILQTDLQHCVTYIVDEFGRKTNAWAYKEDTDETYKNPVDYQAMKAKLDKRMRTSAQNERAEKYAPYLQRDVKKMKECINNEYKPLVAEITELPDEVAKLISKDCMIFGSMLQRCADSIDQLIKCVQSNPNGLYTPKMVRVINTIADAGTVALQAAAAHYTVIAKIS